MSSTTLTPTTTKSVPASEYVTSSDFEGWYLGVTPSPVVCQDSWVWVTSGSYGGCYDPTSSLTYMPTSCIGSTAFVIDGSSTRVCATSASCDSFKLFPTEGAPDSDAVYIIECLQNWPANSIYRQLPARFAASTTATTTSHTQTTNTPKQTATGNSNANDTKESSGISGGAIAGIVVGCVAGIAIIALLFFFRRKILAAFGHGKKPAEDGGPSWSPVYAPPQTQSVTQGSSAIPPSEMSSEQKAIYEAAGSNVHEVAGSEATKKFDHVAGREPGVVHELG